MQLRRNNIACLRIDYGANGVTQDETMGSGAQECINIGNNGASEDETLTGVAQPINFI